MRILEVLFCDNQPIVGDRANPEIDLHQDPLGDEVTDLANAFTRGGLVKHFWNLNGSDPLSQVARYVV